MIAFNTGLKALGSSSKGSESKIKPLATFLISLSVILFLRCFIDTVVPFDMLVSLLLLFYQYNNIINKFSLVEFIQSILIVNFCLGLFKRLSIYKGTDSRSTTLPIRSAANLLVLCFLPVSYLIEFFENDFSDCPSTK